jgi:hypothetical protein
VPASSHTGNAATRTHDRAGAGTRAPAPATPGPRKARAEILGRLLRRAGGYRDPLFERPDLVEDDYQRFLHQSAG